MAPVNRLIFFEGDSRLCLRTGVFTAATQGLSPSRFFRSILKLPKIHALCQVHIWSETECDARDRHGWNCPICYLACWPRLFQA